MKLNNVILTLCVILSGCSAKEQQVDIGECVLKIDSSLVKKNSGGTGVTYEESGHSFVNTLLNPKSVTIEKNKNISDKILQKTIRTGKLQYKTYIQGYKVYQNNKKTDRMSLIFMKQHTILSVNLTTEELKHMLDNCTP